MNQKRVLTVNVLDLYKYREVFEIIETAGGGVGGLKSVGFIYIDDLDKVDMVTHVVSGVSTRRVRRSTSLGKENVELTMFTAQRRQRQAESGDKENEKQLLSCNLART